MAIATVGFVYKAPLKQFVASVGIDQIAINWDQSVRDIWLEVLEAVAKVQLVREFLVTAQDNENYVTVRDRIIGLVAVCDAERAAESAQGAATDPTLDELAHTTLVGMRPFVNRVLLGSNTRSRR